MPVIGRLDEQVHDVLIEPIGKQRPRDGSDAAHTPSEDSRHNAIDEDARGDDARRTNSEKIRAHIEDDDVHVRDDAQLPVWLL
ncbi:MAG: hypothetical protein QOE33_515 [Acidobacteriota bacterium]|nr:hypothetical protein [Acidobacteriota bacterium]